MKMPTPRRAPAGSATCAKRRTSHDNTGPGGFRGLSAMRRAWCLALGVLAAMSVIGLLAARVSGAGEWEVAPVQAPQPAASAGLQPQMVEAGDLIRAAEMRSAKLVDGTGLTVAVLDTGIRATHNDFPAGKIPTSVTFVGGSTDDLHGHGTHMAGIIAAVNGTRPGVAPGAKIIPLKVLDDTGNGTLANVSSALQWVINYRDTYSINAVCLSLGNGANYTTCPTDTVVAIRSKIQALRGVDVPVVIAAGNSYYTFGTQGMPYPAIIPEAISAGAVFDAYIGGPFTYPQFGGAIVDTTAPDRIAPFSQRLSEAAGGVETATGQIFRTDIFAPGADILSTGIESDTDDGTMAGTDQAAAVTTGAVLLLQQYYRTISAGGALPTVTQIENWLRAGGVAIGDGDDEDDNVPHTNETFTRLDCMGAAAQADLSTKPDLVIESVTPSKTSLTTGEACSVVVKVRNVGGVPVGAFRVGFYANLADAPATGTPPDQTYNVGSLAAGATTPPITFSGVSYPTSGTKRMWALADQLTAITESDETNNFGPAGGQAVTVIPATTTLGAADVTGKYSDRVTLAATLTSAGIGVSGATIAFQVDGAMVGTGVTAATGTANFSYTITQGQGNYAVKATYAGDTTYAAAVSSDETLTVTQEDATLAYTGDTTTPTAGTVDLKATLTQEADGNLGDITKAGQVHFVVKRAADGATLVTTDATIAATGVAAATTTLVTGSYTVDVSLLSNSYFTAPAAADTITVGSATTLTVADLAGQYSDKITLSAKLTSGGLPVSGKSVSFLVDGAAVGSGTTNAGGDATYIYTLAQGQGARVLKATFAGDASFAPASSANQVLTVTREDATLAYTGDTSAPSAGTINLKAQVTQAADGSPGDITRAGQVRFVVKKATDGSTVATVTTTVDGTGAAAGTAGLPVGAYTVDVTMLSNNYFTAAGVAAAVTIGAPTALATADASGQYSDKATLTAVLTSAGSGVVGKTVRFSVDGTEVGTGTTNGSGVAIYDYPVAVGQGDHTLQATFVPDPSYIGSTSTAKTLTVTSENATLAYTGDTSIGAGGVIRLEATVAQAIDGSLGDITKAGQVQFVVKNAGGTTVDTVTAAVGTSGEAVGLTTALPLVPYTVDLSLLPNLYFTAPDVAAAGTVRVAPALALPDTAVQYSDQVTLTATLTDNGVGLAGKTVSFLVGGTEVGTGTTDAAGVATFTYAATLGQGTYPLLAVSTADDTYASASSAAKTLTVTREGAALAYTGDTSVPAGGIINLAATVTQAADGSLGDITKAGKVRFVLRRVGDGSTAATVDATVNAAGVAAGTTPALPSVPYAVDLSLLANDYFTAPIVPGAGAVGVTPTLALADATAQHSDKAALTATLTDGAGGIAGKTITFLVAGTAVGTGLTNGSGVATTLYTVNAAQGTYTLDATVDAGGSYTATASTTKTLTVTREDATLAYTGDTNVPVGGIITLKAKVTQAADGNVGDITKAGKVRFLLKKVSDGSVDATVDATVDAAGVAQGVTPALPQVPYTVDLALLTNNYFTAPAVVGAATIGVAPTLTMSNAAGQYSDRVTLTATLAAGGTGVSGKSISFRLDGAEVGTATTNSSGIATLDTTITLPWGGHTLKAVFAGDASYSPADTGDKTLDVAPESATLAYTGSTAVVGGTIALAATLTQEDDGSAGDLARAGNVHFVVKRASDGNVLSVQVGAVNAAGVATATATGLPLVPCRVEARLLSTDYFTAPSVLGVVISVAPTLTVLDAAGQYSDHVLFTATLSDGAGIAGRSISFLVDGTVVGTGTTDAAGVATYDYTIAQGQGSYVLAAAYAGDANYAAVTSAEQALAVAREIAALTYTGATAAVGGVVNLQAAVTQNADGSLGDITRAGQVRFVLRKVSDGSTAATVDATVDAAGVASAATAALPVVPYTIDLSLLANDYFTAPAVPGAATVRTEAALALVDRSAQYSDKAALTAILTDAAGGVGGKTVSFQVDSTTVGTATTNAGGMATLLYAVGKPQGSYSTKASFPGDATYAAVASTQKTLTVTREDATLAYTGDTTVPPGGVINLKAAVTQAADGNLGVITRAGTVRFTLKKVADGTTVATVDAVVDALGVAAGTTAALPLVPYTVDLSLLTNDYFTAPPATGAATISAAPALSVEDATAQYSDKATLTATFTDTAGGVAGKTVAFLVDGTGVGTATTIADGTATLQITVALAQGAHTLQATFAGNGSYVAASSTLKTLTVTREAATLAYTGDTSVPAGGLVNLKATVTQEADGDLGEITRAGQVRFTVKKVSDGSTAATVDATVDATGVASGTTPALALEAYTVDLSLLPNDYFTAPDVTAAATLGIESLLTTVDAAGEYSDSVTLTATLTDGAAGIAGKTIAFLVDGVEIGTADTAGPAGTANLDYTIQVAQGSHALQAVFVGDATYAPATSTEKELTVTREGATLAYTGDLTVPAGGAINLKATLTQAADGSAGDLTRAGKVRFILSKASDNSVVATLDADVDAAGEAAVTTDALPAVPYIVDLSLLTNDYFTAPTVADAAIIGAQPALSVADAAGQYGDKVTFTATLTDAAAGVPGKTISFRIDGTEVGTALTDGSGAATFVYTVDAAQGDYALTAMFAGDTSYAATASPQRALSVTREDATLSYTGDPTVPAGGVIHLEATVTQAADGSMGDITRAGLVRFTLRKVSDGLATLVLDAPVTAAGVAGGDTPPLPAEPYIVDLALLANDYFTAPDVNGAHTLGVPTLALFDASGQYSDKVTLRAVLTSGSTAIAAEQVIFVVDGTTVGTGLTGADGTATFEYTIAKGKGIYTLQATFAGDGQWFATTSTQKSLTVTPEDATVAYTGETRIPAGAPTAIVLGATVTQAADGSTGNIALADSVLFTIKRQSDGTVVDTQSAPVQPDGTVAATSAVLPNVAYDITATLADNNYFAAPTAAAVLSGTPTLVVDSKTVQVNQGATLTATLTTGGAPLPGKRVYFTVDGVARGSALTNSAGIASVTVTVDKPMGTYPVVGTFNGDASYVAANGSATITVRTGTAWRLGFQVQPSNATATQAITPAVTVVVQDRYGNPVPDATNPVSLTVIGGGTGATLSGGSATAAAAGVATFAALSVDRLGSGYRLIAASPGLTSATSDAFNVAPGAAARLGFALLPTTPQAGQPFNVVVAGLDAGGNTAPSFNGSVTLALKSAPASAALTGTQSVSASGGLARFYNMRVNRPGTYVLTATSGGMVVDSASLTVTAGPAARVLFVASPGNHVSGRAIAPAIRVSVVDSAGNVVPTATNPVTLALQVNSTGADLQGTRTVAAINGVATFADLDVTLPGRYVLSATAPGLTRALSAAFSVYAATPAKLAFEVQPSAAAAGATLTPAVKVAIKDALGNTLTTATDTVSLILYANASKGKLLGTKTVAAVDGVATFSDLSVDKAGTAYRIRATVPGVPGVDSAQFDIAAP